MTDSNPLHVYREWLEALNRSDWERFSERLAPDAEFVFTHLLPDDSARLRGRDAMVTSFTRWRSGFTGLHGEIVASVSELDWISIALWWTGITTAGNEIGFASCHWANVSGELIVEMVDYFDQKSYEQQMNR